MPWCTCPKCGRAFGVSIAREYTYEQWLARVAPETRPGETPRVLCLECWRTHEAAKKNEPEK